MYQEMRDLLSLIATEEYTEDAMLTHGLLIRAGFTSHEERLQNLMAISDDVDHDQLRTDIHYSLLDFLDQALAMFSIRLREDTPLPVRNGALEAMLSLSNYGDPDTLRSFLHADNDPEETLAQVLGLASKPMAEQYLEYLEGFNPTLLGHLEAMVEAMILDGAARRPPEETRMRIQRHMRRYEDALVRDALRHGKRLGMPFNELVDGYEEALISYKRHPDALARELVGFILATEVSNGELRDHLLDELEDLIDDVNVITQVELAINKHIAEAIDEQA